RPGGRHAQHRRAGERALHRRPLETGVGDRRPDGGQSQLDKWGGAGLLIGVPADTGHVNRPQLSQVDGHDPSFATVKRSSATSPLSRVTVVVVAVTLAPIFAPSDSVSTPFTSGPSSRTTAATVNGTAMSLPLWSRTVATDWIMPAPL